MGSNNSKIIMPTGQYKRTEYHNAISRKNGFQKGSKINLGRKMKPSQGFQKGHPQYSSYRFKKGDKINLGRKRPDASARMKGENNPSLGKVMSSNINWKGGVSSYYRKKIASPKPENCEVCEISGSLFKNGLFIDHDHKTNKVRGWLCPNCNSALGFAKDNKEILLKLIKYLDTK